jgi:hypothetical protein
MTLQKETSKIIAIGSIIYMRSGKRSIQTYYAVGVWALTEEELSDDVMFWWKSKFTGTYTAKSLETTSFKCFLGGSHKFSTNDGL